MRQQHVCSKYLNSFKKYLPQFYMSRDVLLKKIHGSTEFMEVENIASMCKEWCVG